ncbi:IDEAL domain-containing protein [Paenibacillus polymyxa]|uniref:IDEAL domain-containing protein n=1 Tax=Paenibacillus polymyxa TaxID=1406 RepID=UPI002AB49F47|nr:IDEAL domain-containing protein [Paenibacillus polymyxa]MDY8021085.1 IDEAL domain-containing protein [Paenibacillus polymyxa]
MKFLNQDDIFQILKKSLKKHYGNFTSEPKIEIDVDVMASSYNFVVRKLNFSGRILSFKYKEEILKRRLTLNEIKGMLELELGGKVDVAAYVNEIEQIEENVNSYNNNIVLVATVIQEEPELDKESIMSLIDMAIDMNDREWFIELSNIYKQFVKEY